MALTQNERRRGDQSSDEKELPPLGRQRPATFLALIGAVWLVICVEVVIRWVSSDTEFDPAPRIGPDVMEPWRLISLRVFEAISLIVMLLFV